MRAVPVLLLYLPCAIAANQPTFLASFDQGINVQAMAVDATGNTYMTGSVDGNVVPTTPNALQTQYSGGFCPIPFLSEVPCYQAFVIKLDPSGNIVYATYLGGEGGSGRTAIAVDNAGNAYVAGTTDQPANFPVTPGAALTDPVNAGVFVAKLNPAGSQLVYATLLPLQGSYLGMTIDTSGNVYIAGTTNPTTAPFPTTSAAFQVAPENGDSAGVVLKLNPSGSAVVYATYLSGPTGKPDTDYVSGIAVDAAGDTSITGSAGSAGFPVTPGAYQTQYPGGATSAFVTELNPQGTALIYSTYLGGGNLSGAGTIIKVDRQGGAYVLGGNFLAHLSPDGSTLVYSSYLTSASSMDVDSAGNAYVTGTTGAGFLPTTFGYHPSTGAAGAFAEELGPGGQLVGATYVGDPYSYGDVIAVAPNGSVVIAGANDPVSGEFEYVTNIFVALTVLNAASYVPNTVAPGEIVVIRGYGFDPPLEILFDGFEAPLFYSQPDQINVQVPWEVAGTISVRLTVGVSIGPLNWNTATVPLAVAPSMPGIFYINNSDGSPNSSSNPAKPGDYISIYGTGGGETNPHINTYEVWPSAPLAILTLPVSVTVGTEKAAVLYSGSAPTLETGFFQINARLPADLSASTESLCITIGGVSSQSVPVTIQ